MSDLCSICNINPFKYKCPNCGTKTCSVECVKKHKLQTQCTGQYDNTKFISKNDMDNGKVNRDYNYLLNLNRSIDLKKTDIKTNAKNVFKRSMQQSQYQNNKRFKPAENTDKISRMIMNRFPNATIYNKKGCNVVQIAKGMQRSNQNKTGYDKKLQYYVWTLEWVLIDKNGKRSHDFISFKVNESDTLIDCFPIKFVYHKLIDAFKDDLELSESQSDTSKEDELKIKEDIIQKIKDNCFFYIQDILSNSSKSFISLKKDEKICDIVKERVVLEFPSIFVTMNEQSLQSRLKATNDASSDGDSSDSSSDSDSEDSSDSEDDSDDSEEDDVPEEIPFKKEEVSNPEE